MPSARKHRHRARPGVSPWRKGAAGLAVLTLVLLGIGLPQGWQARADGENEMTELYSTQDRGFISITGNTLTGCDATDTECVQAQKLEGNSPKGNNQFVIQYVDKDDDSTTFNSSMAHVDIPAGATVLKAYLFWSSSVGFNPETRTAISSINNVKFKTPGAAAYTDVAADKSVGDTGAEYQHPLDNYGTNGHYKAPREAWADVTDLVAKSATGDYWVADVPSNIGNSKKDLYAGWALVVVVKDATKPLRDLRVFNTTNFVKKGRSVVSSISGFITPPSGPVNAKIGSVVWEGDSFYQHDYMKMNGTRLSTSSSPSDNFFNSSVSLDGVNREDRNPNYPNTMAVDAKIADASGILKNGDRSAKLSFGSNGDYYYISALTTQIDLYLPDVQLEKSVTNLTAMARGASPETPGKVGDILEYTLIPENQGEAVARTVVVHDNLPADTEYVAGSLRVRNTETETALTDAKDDDAGEVTDRQVVVRVGSGANGSVGGDINQHANRTVKFKVKVLRPAAGGNITNTAGVTYTGEYTPDRPPYANPSNEVVRPIAKRADVGITKQGPVEIAAGAPIEWTLTAINNGPNTAKDVTVTDLQPAGVTGLALARKTAGCAVADNQLKCSWGELAKGASRTIKLRARATGDGAQAHTVPNTARVTTSSSDTNPDNDTATSVTQVRPFADLSLTKQAEPANVVPGNTFTWKLVATNNGPAPSKQVTVADTLPAGLTIAEDPTTSAGSCTHTETSLNCALGDVAPKGAVTITVPTRLDPAWTQSKPIVNTATVSSPVTDDPTPDNNTATGTVTPKAPSTDVSVVKTAGGDTAVPGRPLTYTLAVAAAGPSAARNVVVSDELPTGLQFVSATVPGGTCKNHGQTITCPLGDLPVGSNRAVTVRANVAPGAQGKLRNTARVSTSTPDSNPDNNTSTATTPLRPQADVTITKTAAAGQMVAGNQVTYTLQVTNNGPSTAKQIRVTDALPAALQPVSASSTGAQCTRDNATFTCTKDALGSGENFAVTVVARIGADAAAGQGARITNTARVTAQTPDPQPDNNEASHTLTPTASADLEVVKTAGAESFVPGGDASWTLRVRNLGPSTARDVVVSDPLPAELAAATAKASADQGASCSIAHGALKCTAATLAPNGIITVKLTGKVAAAATAPQITNTATVTSSTPDSSNSNNSSTVTTPLVPNADLAVTKTAPAHAVAGKDITWQIRVTNNGPSVAKPVTVVDPIPPHIANVRVQDKSCHVSEQGTEVSCTLSQLAPGASHVFTVVGTADAGIPEATDIANKASASSPATDPKPGNNSGTSVTNVVPKARVMVTKTASAERFTAGENASYTIAVTNAGPSTARNVQITDPMPRGLTALAATGPGECNVKNNRVTCTVAALAADPKAPAVFKVNVRVGANVSDTVTNTVNVHSDTPNPDGETPHAETTTPVGSSADVVLTKTANQAKVVAGGLMTWTLTATNQGPSVAKQVTIADTLPAGVSLQETPDGCSYDDSKRLLACAVGNMAVGNVASFDLPVKVAEDAAAGALKNTATAGSGTEDPNPDNNTGTSTVTVTQNSQLTLTKKAAEEQATPGKRLEWLVKVANAGPSTAHGVQITDALPQGLSNVSAAVVEGKDCKVDGRNVTCVLGDLAVGERVVRIGADVAANYSGAEVENIAKVTTESPSNAPGDTPLTATSKVPVVPTADLSIVKTVTAADGGKAPVAGQRVRYVLAVTNNGPSIAPNATITDALPAGLSDFQVEQANQDECELSLTDSKVSATSEEAKADEDGNAPSAEQAAGSGVLTCKHAESLAVGKQWNVTLTAMVAPDLAGTRITNTAETTWPGKDPNGQNNGSTVTFTPTRSVGLTVTKSADKQQARPGQTVVWTVVIGNSGPSDAVRLKLGDAIDKRLKVTSIDASEALKCAATEGRVDCTIAKLAAGQSATVKYTTRVEYGTSYGDLPNVAQLSDPKTGKTVPGEAHVKIVPWPHVPSSPGTESVLPPVPGTPGNAGTPGTPGPNGGTGQHQGKAGGTQPSQQPGTLSRLAATGAPALTVAVVLLLLLAAAAAVSASTRYNRRR